MLAEGARCQEGEAADDLSANITRAEPVSDDLVASALALLGADNTACEPVREAARALGVELSVAMEPDASVTDPARALVAATLAEADRRAAAMKFEVGPPPLNLSRGRQGGS